MGRSSTTRNVLPRRSSNTKAPCVLRFGLEGPRLEPFITTAASSLPSGLISMDSGTAPTGMYSRSEEHTSELQSQSNLVCRLLLEKKKKTNRISLQRYTKM